MKLKVLITLMVGIFALSVTAVTVWAQGTAKIIFFYGTGCPHCAEVEKYFEENGMFDKYSIEKREIYFDRDNALLFNQVMDRLGVTAGDRGVPMVVIGNGVIMGDKPIIETFTAEADKFLAGSPSPIPSKNSEGEK